MSNERDIHDYLVDMLEAIEDLRSFTLGMTFEEFSVDRKTYHACIRSLEIIGEATKKIPHAVRDLYPDLPWQAIAGMRDKLIHEYFGVDLSIVWHTIHEDLDPFEQTLKKLLRLSSGAL